MERITLELSEGLTLTFNGTRLDGPNNFYGGLQGHDGASVEKTKLSSIERYKSSINNNTINIRYRKYSFDDSYDGSFNNTRTEIYVAKPGNNLAQGEQKLSYRGLSGDITLEELIKSNNLEPTIA